MIDINVFWKDVLAQNREKLPAYFCEDARIATTPATGMERLNA